jgi:pyruvate dehydrogenase E1 component alpha subunit
MAWGEHPSGGEHAAWFERHDPVLRIARDMLAAKTLSAADLTRIDEEVRQQMDAAERFAVDSPWPEPHTAFDHVFA